MPSIYPPKLSEVYETSSYIPSSISTVVISDTPINESVLVSYISGFTTWDSPPASIEHLSTQTLTVHNKFYTSSLYTNSLSTGTIFFTAGQYGNITASTLSTNILDTNYTILDTLITQSTIAQTVFTQPFITPTLASGSIYQSTTTFSTLLTESFASDFLSTTTISTQNAYISSIEANGINSQFFNTSNAQVDKLTASQLIQSSTLNANTMSSLQITSKTISTNALYVCTINGLTFPQPIENIENLVISSLLATNRFQTSSLISRYASTAYLSAATANFSSIRFNELSTYQLDVKSLTYPTFETAKLSTTLVEGNVLDSQSTIAGTLSTSSLIVNSYMQGLSANTIYVSTSQMAGSFLSTSFVGLESLSSFILESQQTTFSSLESLRLSTGTFVGYTVSADSFNASSISTSAHYTSSLQYSGMQTNIANIFSTEGNAFNGVNVTTSSAQSQLFQAQESYASTLEANILYTKLVAIEQTAKTNTLDTYNLQAIQVEARNAYFSSLASHQVSTLVFEGQTISLENLYTDFISTATVNSQQISAESVTISGLSTNQLEVAQVSTGQLYSDHISSGFLSAFSATVDTLNTDFIRTETFNGSSILASTILSDYISTYKLYASDIQIKEPIAYFLSTNEIEAYLGDIKHVASGYTSAQSTIANILTASTLIVEESIAAPSTITTFVSTMQGISGYGSTQDLLVSSINGLQYPPPFQVEQDIFVSTVNVEFILTTSTLHTTYLSVGKLSLDFFASEFLQINTVSSANAYIPDIYSSSLSADFISTSRLETALLEASYVQVPELHISSTTATQLTGNNLTISSLSTSVLYSEFMTGSQQSASLFSTIDTQIPIVFASSFQSFEINADFLKAIEGDFSRIQLCNISTNHLQADEALVSTVETVLLQTDVLYSQTIAAQSSFSQMISTGSLFAQTAEGNSWYVSRLSLSSLEGLQGTFADISTFAVSTTILEGGYSVISSLQATTLSSQTLSANDFRTSSLNATVLEGSSLFTNTFSTLSLSTNILQVARQEADELVIQTINADFLSTGKLDATLVNSISTTVEQFFINEAYFNKANLYSLSTTLVSSGILNAGLIVAPSSIFSTLSTGILETEYLSTSLLNVEYQTYANTLYTNSISTNIINAYSISTYTEEVYGSQTLIVLGSTIFSGPVITQASFSISTLDVQTLTVNSNITGNSVTYITSKVSSISTSFVTANSFLTSSVTTDYLSSYLVSTKTLAIDGAIVSDFVKAKTLVAKEAITSSISFQYINAVSSLNEIALISSFEIESGTFTTNSFSSLNVTAENISAPLLSISSLYIQHLSTGSVTGYWNSVDVSSIQVNSLSSGSGFADFGEFSTLQFAKVSAATLVANSIVTTSLFAESLSTTTMNFGIIAAKSLESQSTTTQAIQSSSLNLSSLHGLSLSTGTLTVYTDTTAKFTSTIANSISTGAISAETLTVSSIQTQHVFSVNTEADTAYARLVSSQYTSTGSILLNNGTVNISSIRTNELAIQSIISDNDHENSLQIGFISAAVVQGGIANAQLLSTQALSTTWLIGHTLSLDSLSTQSISTGTLFTSSLVASQVNTNAVSTQTFFANSIVTSSFNADSVSSIAYLIQRQTPIIASQVTGNYLNTATLYTSSALFSTVEANVVSTTNITNNGMSVRFNSIFASQLTLQDVQSDNASYGSTFTSTISTSYMYGTTAIFGAISTNFISTQAPIVGAEQLETKTLYTNILSAGTLEVSDAFIYSRIFTNNLVISGQSNLTANFIRTPNVSTSLFSTTTITIPQGGQSFVGDLFADRVSTGFLLASTFYTSTINTVRVITSNVYIDNFQTRFISTAFDISTTMWETSSLFTNILSTGTLSTGQLDARAVFISDVFNIEFSQPFSNVYYNINTNTINSLSTDVYRITHSSTLNGSNKYIRSYISNPTLWVACGDDTTSNAKLKYSTDGRTWSNSSGATFSGPAYGVSFNDQLQRWVAVGSNDTSAGTIKTSTDGKFWQNSISGGFSNQGNAVASGYDSNGDSIFVAAGNGPIITSLYNTPNDLPNNTLWLDGADSTAFTLNGTSVSSWIDKSGLGQSVFQTGAAAQPLRITNGVDFNGTTQYLSSQITVPISSYFANNSRSIFVVANVNAIGTNVANPYDNDAIFGDRNGNVCMFLKNTGPPTVGAYNYDGVLPGDSATTTFSLNTSTIFNYTFSSGLLGIRLNGGTITTVASGNTTTMTNPLEIGRQYNSDAKTFDGQIYEMLIYSQDLNTSNRQVVEGYLAWKWNLVSSLPSDHPYKNYGPAYASNYTGIKYSYNGFNWTNVLGSITNFNPSGSVYLNNSSNIFNVYGVSYSGRSWIVTGSNANNSTILVSALTNFPTFSLASAYPSIGNALAWNGINYIAAGKDTTSNAMIKYANANGTTWTSATSGGFATQGYGVAGNEKVWVAVGDGSTSNQTIQYSTDNGTSWTSVSGPAFNTTGGRGVAWGDSAFVAVGDASSAGERIKFSTNGSNWSDATSGGFDTAAYGVTYSKLYTPNFTTTGLEVLGQNQVYLSDSNSLTTPQSQTLFTATPSTFIMGRTLVIDAQSNSVLVKSNATIYDRPQYTLDIDGTLRTTNDAPIKLIAGSWFGTSDMRLKTNIVSTNIDTCYETVKQIPLHHYRYIDDFYRRYQVHDKSQLGFLAQEVQPFFPEAVKELPDPYFGHGSLLALNITPLMDAQYGATQKLMQLHEARLPQFEAIKEACESTLSQVPENFYSVASTIFTTYNTYVNASTTMATIEATYDAEIEAQARKVQMLQETYDKLQSKVSTMEAFAQSLSQPPPAAE
jgi:hypothetical protein